MSERRRRIGAALGIFAIFVAIAFIFTPHLFIGDVLGTSCEEDGDCRSGTCLKAGGRGYCSSRCEDDDDCSEGLRCRSLRIERACLKSLGFGEPCFADGECRGGLCVALGGEVVGVCGQPCEGKERACPPSARCESLAEGSVCVPGVAAP